MPSTPTPATSPPAGQPENLAGTTWLATAIGAKPIGADPPPSLSFDWLGRPNGTGFSGCDDFAFEVQLGSRTIAFDGIEPSPFGCVRAAGDVERAFLAALTGAQTWTREGDTLSIAGNDRELLLARDLPSSPNSARFVADALRGCCWRLLAARGVPNRQALPLIIFGDTQFVAAGECGFSGRISFLRDGTIRIYEVGWDTGGCGDDPGDGRPQLQSVLESVTTGRVRRDGRVVLSGPRGQIVLGFAGPAGG